MFIFRSSFWFSFLLFRSILHLLYECNIFSHSEDIIWGVFVIHPLLQCHCVLCCNLESVPFWPISCWKLFSNVKFLVSSFRLMTEALKAKRTSPVSGQGSGLGFVVSVPFHWGMARCINMNSPPTPAQRRSSIYCTWYRGYQCSRDKAGEGCQGPKFIMYIVI